MRSIPVDTTELSFKALSTEPKIFEGAQTKNKEGLPQWKIQCLVTPLDGKPELVDINIAQRGAPEFEPLAELDFTGLVARSWAMGDRSGISFSALAAA